MKIFNHISLMAAALSAVLSCTGHVDEEAFPVLSADRTEVDLADDDASVVFTVMFNGEDVTSDSEIFAVSGGTPLEGNVFMAETAGESRFFARYEGMDSELVGIKVVDTRPVVIDSRYDRHVSVVEFTGAWCTNCPTGYNNMMGILSLPALSSYLDNIHICAFHSDSEGDDDMAIPQTQDIFALCRNLFAGLAYPSYVVDLRTANLLTSEGSSTFRPSLMAAFNDHPCHCGVKVSSALSEDRTSAQVSVEVASEYTNEYSVVVLVVEDGVIGYQKGVVSNGNSEADPEYRHAHVVRKVVTSYEKTFKGERLTPDAIIPAGETASAQWNFSVDPLWNTEKTQIYAWALDASGHVNNMNVCGIDGGDSGYDLK